MPEQYKYMTCGSKKCNGRSTQHFLYHTEPGGWVTYKCMTCNETQRSWVGGKMVTQKTVGNPSKRTNPPATERAGSSPGRVENRGIDPGC